MTQTNTIPTLRQLMAAGAHFGHKKERSHPKAKDYIYILREGIYIIDLAKTQAALTKALQAVAEWTKQGKTILFVGTKPQAADIVKAAAEAAGMPYIANHWPGGMLTNFETILQNLKQLEALEAKLTGDQPSSLTKKERGVIAEKVRKSVAVLGGIRDLKDLPDALFVVDVNAESTAVTEAYRLGIPIVAICDTNANPERIDYPIPANDDARKAIELIVNLVSQTIMTNRGQGPVVATSTVETAVVAQPVVTVAETVQTDDKAVVAKPKRARTKKTLPAPLKAPAIPNLESKEEV